MTEKKRRRLYARGHALSIEWSGEYGDERSSTGYCKCGRWEESCSSGLEVRNEYRFRLMSVLAIYPGDFW